MVVVQSGHYREQVGSVRHPWVEWEGVKDLLPLDCTGYLEEP